MAKVKELALDIRGLFRGFLKILHYKNVDVVQAWPSYYTTSKSDAAKFNWHVKRESEKAAQELSQAVIDYYKQNTQPGEFTWHDYFVSLYMKAYYATGTEPIYLTDFSYITASSHIQIAYTLSKEGPHTITRHKITVPFPQVPVRVGKYCSKCEQPPDPEPDEEVEVCDFQGEVDFTDIPEDAEMKKVVSVEEEFTCIDTWADLLWKWWSVGWEAEAETPGVSFYGIIALLAGEYLGLIKSSKIHETINLLAEDLGVAVDDVYKAWFAYEGSPENEALYNFDCIWGGDWEGDYKPGQSWKDPDNVEHPPHWYLKIDEPGFLTWYEEMKIKYGFPWSATNDPDEITWKMVEIVVNEIPYESSEETAPTLTPAGTIALGKGNCDDQSILWFALCYKALLDVNKTAGWINKHASIVTNTCYNGGHCFGWWKDKHKSTHIAELTAGPVGMPSSWRNVVSWDHHGWQCIDWRVDKEGEWECKKRIKKIPGNVGNLKCVETGDIAPLQKGKINFGNAMEHIGKANQSFHFESIEIPTDPQQPCCPGNEVESFSGGIVPASTFKVKFCYGKYWNITYTQLAPSMLRWGGAGGDDKPWEQIYQEAWTVYWAAGWTEQAYVYIEAAAAGRDAGGGWLSCEIVTTKYPIQLNIGTHITQAQFDEVTEVRITVEREKTIPTQQDGGFLETSLGETPTPQIYPETTIRIPKALLTYPTTSLILRGKEPALGELNPGDPTGKGTIIIGYTLPRNPTISVKLARKGDYPHIDSPPFGFSKTPHYLRVSTLDPTQRVVSPFILIK